MLVFIDERDPVTLVASSVDTTDRSGSYTFSGLNFGDDFTGRLLVAVIALTSTNNVQQLNQTSVTIGGSSATGDDSGDAASIDTTGCCGMGVWSAQPSGTSGSVVVNFTSGTSQVCSIHLFALAGLSSATPFAQGGFTSGVGETGISSGSSTLNVPAGGIIVGGVVRGNNTNSITLSGITKVYETNIDTVHRIAVGYDSRLAAETGRSFGFSSTGRTAAGMRVHSFG